MANEFVCDRCPESFSSARGLASHMKIHSKSVVCPVCDKEVRYLAVHVKREHSADPLVKLEVGLADVIGEVRALRREVALIKDQVVIIPGD